MYSCLAHVPTLLLATTIWQFAFSGNVRLVPTTWEGEGNRDKDGGNNPKNETQLIAKNYGFLTAGIKRR